MKKIIAVILCLIMLLSPSAFAQESSEVIEVLNALDIGNFENPDEIMTRGEFVGALSDILNYSNRPVPTNGVFSDAVEDYEYSGAIYDAYNRGLVSGYADGTFGTKNPILYEHAVKILVSALGYDALAAVQGGYPSGYMTIAAQKRIIKGVTKSAGDTLTQAEGARLIANAMDTPVLQQVIFGSENPGYEAYEGETLLALFAKIKKIEGVVSDNGVSSLVGGSATQKGNVVIGGTVYSEGETNATKLLGYKCVAYSTELDDGTEKILFIKTAESVRLLEIPAAKLISSDSAFSVRNIVYEDVYGNITAAKVEGAADVIYNGKAYLDLTAADLKITLGKLILADNNSDGIFDVISVQNSEVFMAAGVSVETKTIYKKNGGSLKLQNAKNIEVFKDGVKCELTDIVEWDAVSVRSSIDKSIITLDVSSAKLSGKVESITTSFSTISVGGVHYNVINDDILSRIEVSGSYEFCLDGEMNVVGIKSENHSDKYVGIVVDAAIKDGVGSKLQIKIFSSLGNFDVLDFTEKTTVDGNGEMTDAQMVTYILNNMQYKLVSCKLNAAKEVIDISLPYSGAPGAHQTEESLRVDYDKGDSTTITCFGSEIKNFNGSAVARSTSTVFLMPLDKTDFDSYAITKGSFFKHSTNYIVSTYSVGAENGYSEYVIRYGQAAAAYTSDHRPMVVSQVSTVLDDNGETTKSIRGYEAASEVKIVAKNSQIIENAGIKAGDIVRYQLDTEGRIVDIKRVLDGENVKLLNEENSSNYGASPRLGLYDVYSRYDNIVGCTKTDLSRGFDEETVKAGLMIQTVSTKNIYKVNSKRDYEVTGATYNDINAYTVVATERSKIFVYSYSGGESLIVIYD